MSRDERFRTFADFYPLYLGEHTSRVSRRLHFCGTSIACVLLVVAVVNKIWWLPPVALIQGYACAWVGHFFFEHNKPATFQYPLFSFLGDLRLWWEIISGKIPF